LRGEGGESFSFLLLLIFLWFEAGVEGRAEEAADERLRERGKRTRGAASLHGSLGEFALPRSPASEVGGVVSVKFSKSGFVVWRFGEIKRFKGRV
jgi:hypothetical protein